MKLNRESLITNNDASALVSRSSNAIKHLQSYKKGWLSLIIPFVGLIMAGYFDYSALKNNEFSRKTLAYTTAILALLESYYCNLHDLLLILIVAVFCIFSICEFYLYHNQFDYKNPLNIFKVINAFLDNIGQKQLNVYRDKENIKKGLSYIDSLSGDEFENYMVFLLNHVGFHDVKHTPYSNDFGLDAIGYNSKNQKVGWQFKHYNQGDVGYNAIEETMGGSAYYGTTINYLLTNSNNITANAIKGVKQINHNAGENVIHLINRNDLQNIIKQFE